MSALGEWIEKIHTNAVAHGWWERPRLWSEVRMLVVTELAEAAEEFRSGRMDAWYLSDSGTRVDHGYVPPGRKPEGFPIEIADAAIRLLDYAGFRGVRWDLDDEKCAANGTLVDFPHRADPLAQLDRIVAILHDEGQYEDDTLVWLGVGACFAMANAHGFDLLRYIRLKHEYNVGRPYKHGKVA